MFSLYIPERKERFSLYITDVRCFWRCVQNLNPEWPYNNFSARFHTIFYQSSSRCAITWNWLFRIQTRYWGWMSIWKRKTCSQQPQHSITYPSFSQPSQTDQTKHHDGNRKYLVILLMFRVHLCNLRDQNWNRGTKSFELKQSISYKWINKYQHL
jgi:hypothetical protein